MLCHLPTDFDAVNGYFYKNYTTLDAGKCHFMRLGKDTANKSFIFKNLVMRVTKEQKILVLLYTTNGTVKVTLRNYVKKASQK